MPALLACDSVRGMAMAYLSLMPRVDRLPCMQCKVSQETMCRADLHTWCARGVHGTFACQMPNLRLFMTLEAMLTGGHLGVQVHIQAVAGAGSACRHQPLHARAQGGHLCAPCAARACTHGRVTWSLCAQDKALEGSWAEDMDMMHAAGKRLTCTSFVAPAICAWYSTQVILRPCQKF